MLSRAGNLARARNLAVVFGLVSAAVLLPGEARADQIDGHWCFTDGRNLSIDGAKIVTPGGNRIEGNYARHAFTYVVPDGEAGAGTVTAMNQLNDLMMHLRPDGVTEPQLWRRCTAPTA